MRVHVHAYHATKVGLAHLRQDRGAASVSSVHMYPHAPLRAHAPNLANGVDLQKVTCVGEERCEGGSLPRVWACAPRPISPMGSTCRRNARWGGDVCEREPAG
eukprot:365418-Chlamydomonas_euryale.AAC.1